ncbi:hypothetical protein [Natrinema sp. J7-2]|uniref:hypothetical protein n=1 Tax=Natrinema sp. (strain J7-2) TaxID=406552 RepID=UPI00026D4562|nr:hypothetical protein [Natrinema sp. J7-2]AFO57635.1 hypothetical protein NJ7G_2402 [Natrinema sp. J7-2]
MDEMIRDVTPRDVTPAELCDAVATDLLDAMGWPENRNPTRRTLDAEPVTDQSPLAAVAGIPDANLDAEFVGQVVAVAIAVVARTANPSAAREWLVLVDDLVGAVARNRSDTDGAIRYRGSVFGTAMAAVASEQPTADEWVEALAVRALTLTNETATPHGRESVGGDVEPIVTAFTTALATLTQSGDGTDPNHGALATVDQFLHEIVDQGAIDHEPGLYPLCRIYGQTVAGLVETADDPASAEDVLAPVMRLVEQTATRYEDSPAAVLFGNVFGSMFGAVAGAASTADAMATWVEEIDASAREAATSLQHDEERTEQLHVAIVSAVGWAFDHGCPDDRFGPWLEGVGERLCQSATQAAFVDEHGADAWRRRLDSELRSFAMGCYVDDPAAFLKGVYADIVVAGTVKGHPVPEIDACVAAVYESIEGASEDGHLRTDEPVVGTFSLAVDRLPTGNPRATADHSYLLGQAFRAVGGEDLETAVFDGGCPPDEAQE